MLCYHNLWYGISALHSSSNTLSSLGKRVVNDLIIPAGLASNSVKLTSLSPKEINFVGFFFSFLGCFSIPDSYTS